MTSEFYAEFDSPLPTLLLHSENGLGIFVSLASDPMRRVHSVKIGMDACVLDLSDQEVRVPLRPHAIDLIQSKGAVFAITDEKGLPWFTQEFEASAKQVPATLGSTQHGEPEVGDFSL